MQPKHIMKMPTICTLLILVLTKSSNSSSNDHDDNTNYIRNLVISGFHHGVMRSVLF